MEVKGVQDVCDADTENTQCRICWGNENDETNPLIVACKCKGTVGLIHFNCLKQWILSKKKRNTSSLEREIYLMEKIRVRNLQAKVSLHIQDWANHL